MAYIGSSPIEKGTGLFSQDTFTGDGSTVAFDLSNVIPDGGSNDIQVFVDNVRQQEGSSNAYTVGQDGSGDFKRITFTSAPAASAAIYVLNPGTKNVQQISTISDNTVTTAKVQDNAVTVAKLASTLDLSSNTVTLPDTSVATAKLAADAVDATKLADDAVSEEHLDVTAVTGHTELAATADADDVLLVYDTSSSSLKKIQRSNLVLQSPTFTSISPSNANTGDGTGNHTFVITGTNFDSAPVVKFRGNDGSALISSTSTTRNSPTQLTVVIAKSSLPDSNEPYDVSVANSSGLAIETTSNPLNINASPVFVTAAGTLGTVNGGASVNLSVNATDPESAGNVTFEIQSGALPAGLSLTNTAAEGGTAKITGTATNPVANTTSNFVLRAVDAASNVTSRAFSITVNRVFTQTSFTSSGTFAVPSGVTSLDAVLVVAGGGSGGGDNGGGGGGGGTIFMPAVPVSPGGTIAITVGDGASPNPGGEPLAGLAGQDSVFGASPSPGTTNPLTAKGGGKGGGGAPGERPGGIGGSGGGGSGAQCSPGGPGSQPTQSGDSGAYGFGNNGGTGVAYSHQSTGTPAAGGGGGAGAVGGNSGGNGGVGKAYTIADGTTSVYYAGGGGAGMSSSTGGQGGAGKQFPAFPGYGTNVSNNADGGAATGYFGGGGGGAGVSNSSPFGGPHVTLPQGGGGGHGGYNGVDRKSVV